jgi:NAD(P)-dependent dehydrogenase (short-subunit alcohol dehydrogenase family)
MAYGGGKARHVVGNVRNPPEVEAAVGRAIDVFGGLDLVVGAARARGRIEIGTDPAEAEAVLATNVLGMHHTLRAGAARMNDGGRLVAVGATCLVSAAALRGLVGVMAPDLASRGIACNAVIPAGAWRPETDTARIVEAALRFLSEDAPNGSIHRVDAG